MSYSVPPPSVVSAVSRAFGFRFWPVVVGAAADAWREVPAARLTSWYRSPSRNAATPGAAAQSQHLIGAGFDFGADLERDRAAIASALRRRGFTVVEYRTHVHAQVFPASFGATRRVLG